MTFLEKHADKWIPEPNSGCYLWLGALGGGRPQVKIDDVSKSVYALVCDEEKGLLPDGLERSHTCLISLCVNPNHIMYETHTENEARKPSIQRKTASVAANQHRQHARGYPKHVSMRDGKYRVKIGGVFNTTCRTLEEAIAIRDSYLVAHG